MPGGKNVGRNMARNKRPSAQLLRRLNGKKASGYLSLAERASFVRAQLKELERSRLGSELFILMNKDNLDLDAQGVDEQGRLMPSTREQIAQARNRILNLTQAMANIEEEHAGLLLVDEPSEGAENHDERGE